MIYPVKYTHSAMQSAHALSGTAGAMIALLDACLVNNGLLLHSQILLNESSITTRGIWPGIFQPLQLKPLESGDVLENIPSLTGRRILLLRMDTQYTEGRIAIDVSGTWR